MPRRAERPAVLIVDDDAGVRTTLEDILELAGYPARTAATGAAALDLFDAGSFPLAIVDLRLPGVDGIALATRFTERDPRTQVIIVTGNASVESAVSAVRDHGFDYLVKPVQPPELLRTIAAAEDRWRLRTAEDDLQRSESTLQALFEASPLPLLVLDADLRVRLWNRAAERVFGWKADEVMGGTMPMATAPERTQIHRLLGSALAGSPCTGVDVTCLRSDGVHLDTRLSAAAIADGAGAPSAVLAVFEDITEQRQVERHLQHVQRLDAVGRLAGGIAHDFNNLLAVMGSELDLLLSDARLPAHLVTSVRSVRTTAARGAALTRQLLTFARRQPMESTIVAANEVVADLERMLRRLLVDSVQLEVRLDPGAGRVNVDRGKLEQVLVNLVVNARDAIDGTGLITISTSTRAEAPPGAAAPDEGSWVVLSVADTGSGISKGIRSRIFEPFFTTKGEGSGTGLGLATSYGIVEGMGGILAVESEEGYGSTFHVSLPCAVGPASAAPGQGVELPPGGGEAVLLVEDNQALRDVTRRLLIRLGYTVHSAADGVEAQRLIAEMGRPPDLLFVDAHLGMEDGRDLIRSLGSQYAELKVLLTSGSFELAARSDIGVPFIEKPYTLETVARAVRRALDSKTGAEDERPA